MKPTYEAVLAAALSIPVTLYGLLRPRACPRVRAWEKTAKVTP